MEYAFELPDFLQDCDLDTIHQKMMDMLPEDIDKTEGGFPWDFTRPTAYIAAELLEFYVPNIIRLMFPQWSTGEYLDHLATMAQTIRREASYASVSLLISGEPGTIIPTGSVFSTSTTDDEEEAIEFQTQEPAHVQEDGTCKLTAAALIPGRASNVPVGTVVIMSEPITGVTSVTNPEKAYGGTDEEDDDTLRERVIASFSSHNESFVGNDSDYKRWAESVAGMGTAIVISEWNGPETIKIVCIDANGESAGHELLTSVYNKIMSPDEPLNRLAPPNTILTVSAPELVGITYKFTVELEYGYDLETVKETFGKNLETYYKTVSDDGEVKYTRVCSILSGTAGVNDFKDLAMNGAKKNIPVTMEQYPSTAQIIADTASGVND